MGERKVINKYYPPDFDYKKIPGPCKPKNGQKKVRTMLPMSIRCRTCGNYMSEGTKFNSREEVVTGETYLGIEIKRFYQKCTNCSSEFTIKTDSRNSDYVVDYGASRNYKPWREKDQVLDEEKRKRNAEEMGDSMKSLENRTLDSKREMDILAALDEMKSMKSRQTAVSVDVMLEALQREKDENEKKLEEEDEALTKSVFTVQAKTRAIRRINDEDIDNEDDFALFLPYDKGTLGEPSKRRKISDSSQSRYNGVLQCGGSSAGKGKHIFKLPSVEVSIVKKASAGDTTKGNKQAKDTHMPDAESSCLVGDQIITEKQKEDSKSSEEDTSNRIHSLCKQYGSDEDDDE